MDVDARVLKKLVDIMQRDGLDRLRVRVGEIDVDLRMSLPQNAAGIAPQPAAQAGASARSPADEPARAPDGVRKVLAPLVGVFYRAPAPGAKPFVEVGDRVAAGKPLCILEAMKLMNEIVSEYDGTIAKICASDGDLVSLHQELFWVEP